MANTYKATPRQVSIIDSNGTEVGTGTDGELKVIPFDDTKNSVEIITTTVTTTSTEIEVPEGVKEYTIFHQTAGVNVYWGADDVSTSSPLLKTNDVIEISGGKNFQINMITSSGTVNVFVIVTTRV